MLAKIRFNIKYFLTWIYVNLLSKHDIKFQTTFLNDIGPKTIVFCGRFNEQLLRFNQEKATKMVQETSRCLGKDLMMLT